MMKEPITPEQYFDGEDYACLQRLVASWQSADEITPFATDTILLELCGRLAMQLLADDPAEFEWILEQSPKLERAYADDPMFANLVVMGLQYGIAKEDDACANHLGDLYHTGSIVEKDDARAKELYELAERWGSDQAAVNLGYFYEYGFSCEQDYMKAYMQYAKMAALGHPEALYKLGDMYARGQGVERDLRVAWHLYWRCLDASNDPAYEAQAAFRLAEMMGDPDNDDPDIDYDPLKALEMYQLAERGLRVDIECGQTWHEERLQKALEGQERMRVVLRRGWKEV